MPLAVLGWTWDLRLKGDLGLGTLALKPYATAPDHMVFTRGQPIWTTRSGKELRMTPVFQPARHWHDYPMTSF
jgi:hypothetical protein